MRTDAHTLLPDSRWLIIEPLLPPTALQTKGGRPPVGRVQRRPASCSSSARAFLGDLPAEMGCGSGVTCWRRLRDLQAAGVWDEHRETTTAAVERGPDRLEPRLHGQFI